MTIDAIQATNIMQVQQVQQATKPATQPAHVQPKTEGEGNSAQLAQEVQTVKQVTEVAASGQSKGFGSEKDNGSGQQANYLQQAVEKAEEQNEKNNEKLRKTISEINKKMSANTEAVYGYHDETNRVTIKIVDKDSKKVIKEFPAEETLDMIAKAWELAGLMIDERK